MLVRAFVIAFTGCALATSAMSQTISLAVQTGGIAPIIANAIAKVATEKGGISVRARELGSEAQFIPMVNAKQVDLGLSNSFQVVFAHAGKSIFEGRRHPNLRLAFALMPVTIGIAVRADSDIRTISDLKGKRVPGGFTNLRTGQLMWGSVLANAGLTKSDVKEIPVSSYLAMWNQFKQGRLDACNVVVGGSTAKDLSAAVGGLRFISWNDDDRSVKAMQVVQPGSTVEEIQPPPEAGKPHPPVKIQFIRFLIFTHADASADAIYRLTAAVHDNEAELLKSGPLWKRFKASSMALKYGVPYHDGAVRYFKEKGLWPPKN